MKEIGAPAPIVHKVILGESLPGMEDLCRKIKDTITHTLKKSVEAKIDALLIARTIFEYSARPDVIARVAMLNIDPATGKKREGRPKQAHRLAMEVIAAKCRVTERTINNWVNEWTAVCGALKLKPDCKPEDFTNLMRDVGDLHEWFETLPFERTPPVVAEPTPDEIAKSIVAVFEKHFYTDKGTKKLAPAARSAVMQHVNPILKAIGFELMPIGKE